MPQLHAEEVVLEQYSLGTLDSERIPELEEHLLVCESCQSRLKECDEFIHAFRIAAVQPDARPVSMWRRFFGRREVRGLAVAAMAASVLLVVSIRQDNSGPASTVYLQSL